MTYFRSQYTYTTLIILGLILVIQPLINGCTVGVKPSEPVTGCFLPPDVFKKYGAELETASANIGDFTIGKLTVKYEPDLIKVLSDLSRDRLVVDYLVCVAKHRGEIQTSEQAMYLRNKLQFMQSKPPPTADDILKYEREHPFPTNKGKLEVSGADQINKHKHTVFWKEPQDVTRKIGVINSGDRDLIWWLDNFPYPYFFSEADDKESKKLKPKRSSSFTIVRTAMPIEKGQSSYPFDIKGDSDEAITVTIIIKPIDDKAYLKLGKKLKRASENIYGIKSNQVLGSQKDLVYYKLANAIVKEEYPYEKESIRQLINAQLLSKVSQHNASLIAFNQVATFNPSILRNPSFADLVKRTEFFAKMKKGESDKTIANSPSGAEGATEGLKGAAVAGAGVLGIVLVIIGLLIL